MDGGTNSIAIGFVAGVAFAPRSCQPQQHCWCLEALLSTVGGLQGPGYMSEAIRRCWL